MNAPHPAAPALDRLSVCLALADPAGPGLPAAAVEAAREALALAAALGRADDQGRAGAWLCTHLFRLGHFPAVLREAQQALPLLQAAALAPLRHETLRTVTLSACEVGSFDVALDAANELLLLTAASGESGPSLTAAFALAVCLERMGDAWQAVRVLSQALNAHGHDAPDVPLMIALNAMCAVSIGEVHRLTDASPEAEVQQALQRARDAGERARRLLERLNDPGYEVAILGNLGEVLLLQGETGPAGDLLAQAQSIAQQRRLGAYGWRVRCTLSAWLLACGRADEALAQADALLAEMGQAGDNLPQQTLIRARHAAYRACRALGRPDQALAHFEVVERLERRRATLQLRVQSQLFVTRSEAQRAQWQAEQARRDAERHRERAVELAASAESDPLTGLGNRRHLDRRCAELLLRAEQEHQPLALALIDIDRFKQINDTHGHAAGDEVLVSLARLLRENMREHDVLVRHGGEEFVVVLPGMPMARAAEVCERLRERITSHDWSAVLAGGLRLTVSIGLASPPPFEMAALMQLADEALYRAKRSGRDRLCMA